MYDSLREKLNTEMTRKQFLQYMAAILLMTFGLHNLLSLLTTTGKSVGHPITNTNNVASDGFGSRKFGQ